MSDESQLRTIILEPETFDETTTQYEDQIHCYEALLEQAKRSLETFEEYAEFHSVCLEYGPTNYVRSQLEENTVRSLKNMVLQSSTAGKQFPIRTAAQLRERIEEYRDLGIESVTDRSVAFTLLEHIFDSETHEPHAYEILSRLLSNPPSPAGELTAILVRARFVSVAETASRQMSLETYAGELFAEFPDPMQENNATAKEQFQASKERDYASPKKVELAASALARDGDAEILEEYLYLSARDVVERYRHQERDDPWRGELQLALRQWNCILNAFSESHTKERLARSHSYRHVILGELRSGGRWRSQRDGRSLPEANFLSAAGEFLNAALDIRDVDPVRYIKYLSKSFRHQATAAHHREWGPNRGWLATQLIHGQAVEIIIEVMDEFENSLQLKETLLETAALHNFRGHRAAAVVAFEERDLEAISYEVEEALSHKEAVPTSPNTDILDEMEKAGEALLFEETKEFAEALKQYRAMSHPKLDVANRIHLVKIKLSINNDEYVGAKNIAEEEFGESSLLAAATSIVAGDSTNSPRIKPPVLEDLSAVDESAKWLLTYLVHLFSAAETGIGADHIESTLYEL